MIVDRSYIRVVSNRTFFTILTIFVWRSFTRVPPGRFGRISWRPGAQGCSGFQYSHLLLGDSSQRLSGVLTEGFQQLDMIMVGVMNRFWGFMNEMEKFFLIEWRMYVWLYRDVVVKRCMMRIWWEFFMIVYGGVFVCSFVLVKSFMVVIWREFLLDVLPRM